MHMHLAMLAVLGATTMDLSNAELVRARFRSPASTRDVRAAACAMTPHVELAGKSVPVAMRVDTEDCPDAPAAAAAPAIPMTVRLEGGSVLLEVSAMPDDVPVMRDAVKSIGLELKERVRLVYLPPPVAPPPPVRAPAPRNDPSAFPLLAVAGAATLVIGAVVAVSVAVGLTIQDSLTRSVSKFNFR